MLKIPTKMLILVAALVWFLAGAGVASVGVTASEAPWTLSIAGGALVVYALFLVMFLMISRKHIRRILGFDEKLTNLFKFFDAQSYILLAVMVVIGVAVRLSGLVPDFAIALFYTGLGFALVTAAIY
jgi:hypothetical protein